MRVFLTVFAMLACCQLAVQPALAASAWSVTYDKSKLDDSTSVFASLQSSDEITDRFGNSGVATLTIRCKENTTSIYFVFAEQFLADIEGYGRIDYRVDARKAKTISMTASTDSKALGLWSGGAAIPIIKELSGASSLFVRATPFNQSPVEATFPIAGIDDAIWPLKKACGWLGK